MGAARSADRTDMVVQESPVLTPIAAHPDADIRLSCRPCLRRKRRHWEGAAAFLPDENDDIDLEAAHKSRAAPKAF